MRQSHSNSTLSATLPAQHGFRALIFRGLVVLLALAVVTWGVGYRASLYSSQSLVSNSLPPARMLAHRACPERNPGRYADRGAAHLHRMMRPVLPLTTHRNTHLALLLPASSGTAAIGVRLAVSIWPTRGLGARLSRFGLPRPPPVAA